jgi:hypothetical protein
MAGGISNGPNARARDENIGTTGPGLPDEALAEGQDLADELVSDREAPEPTAEQVFGDSDRDDSEAHPS